jgi:hypothetical protein
MKLLLEGCVLTAASLMKSKPYLALLLSSKNSSSVLSLALDSS